jgi:hypothetical protein
LTAAASIAAFFAERLSDLLSVVILAAVGLWAYAAARPQRWAQLLVKLCEIVLHFRRCFSLPAMTMDLGAVFLARHR